MFPNTSNSGYMNGFKIYIRRLLLAIKGIWHYVIDTYRGVDKSYILFWENDIPDLYEKITYRNNCNLTKYSKPLTKSRFPLSVTVYACGPQLFHRIYEIKDANIDITDWVINNRNQIWPTGISEDLLDWGYAEFKDDSRRLFYVCLIRRDLLNNINNYCEEHGLVASAIFPRAALLLSSTQVGALATEEKQRYQPITLTRNGLSESLVKDGDNCRIILDIDGIKTEQLEITFSIKDDNSSGHISTVSKNDLLRNIGNEDSASLNSLNFAANTLSYLPISMMKKGYRLLVNVAVAILLCWSILNIVLSIKESKNSEAFKELELIQSNQNSLNYKVAGLENDIQKYSALISKHSCYGQIINQIADNLPEKLWLSRIELSDNLQAGIDIQLRGYAIDKTDPTALGENIVRLSRVKDIELTSMNLVTENFPMDVPAIYQNQLYSFMLKFRLDE